MVTYPELESATERGGTTILSYNLQMDDGAGSFRNIHGFDSDVLDLFAQVEADEGVTYSFRYRARNLYGWSEFSPVTQILAAGLPSAPPKPSFIAATDNSISVQLYPSLDSLGAAITHYVLEVDKGSFNTAFSEVGSYDQQGFAMQHTLQFVPDGLITGKIYSFRMKARNVKGDSEYSEILSVACVSPPSQANKPEITYSLSTRTSIFVSWLPNEDGLDDGGLITGYKLYKDDGYGGQLKLAFDTVGYSAEITEFMAVNLTQALLYRF